MENRPGKFDSFSINPNKNMDLKAFFYFKPALIFVSALLAIAVFVSPACASPSKLMDVNKPKPIRVLMVGGGSSHDFDKWYKNVDAATLSENGFAKVTYTDNTDSIAAYLPQTDVLFLANNQPVKSLPSRQAIFDFVNSGRGLVLAHAALWYNFEDWPTYNQQLLSGGTRSHDKYGSFEVTVTKPNHPVMKGVEPKITLQDERYHDEVDAAGPGIEVLANSSLAGSDKIYPAIFVVKNPKARIVAIALGHDGGSHNTEFYKTVLRNAVKWTAGR